MPRRSAAIRNNEEARPVRRLASAQAAATYCDVDVRTVRRWITEGRITGYRVGKYLVKVDLNEVDERIIRPIPAAEAREMPA